MTNAINRVKVVKGSPTKAEKQRLKTIRDRYQKEKPALADLIASGEYSEPISQEEFWQLTETAEALKAERKKAHVTLAEVSKRSGIDVAALSRLENGVYDNPTTTTLSRYAQALGKVLVFKLVDAPRARKQVKRG